jgi:hypothetical protein
MNNRSLLQALAIGTVVLAIAAAIAIGAYNAGVAHGIAESARAAAAPAAGAAGPYPYVWARPWGFGFFPFFPILFLFFLFFVARGLLWRGPWRGGWGCGYYGDPRTLEQWHRDAHAGPTSTRPAPDATA